MYYQILPAQSHHKIGSLFLNVGGPGGATMPAKQHIQKHWPKTILEHFDVVLFDPRGTGHGYDQTEIVDAHKTASTYQNIEDLEALRQHLGLDKIHLYGISYGTAFFTAYAIKYPEHVASLLLDSAIPSDWPDIDEEQSVVDQRYLDQGNFMDFLYERITGQPISAAMWNEDQITAFYEMSPSNNMEPEYFFSENTYDGTMCSEYLQPYFEKYDCVDLFDMSLDTRNSLKKHNIELSRAGTNLQTPVLIVASDHDVVTPLVYAENLFQTFKSNGANITLIRRQNSMFHSNIYDEITSKDVDKLVTSFFMGQALVAEGECSHRTIDSTEIDCDNEETSMKFLEQKLIPMVESLKTTNSTSETHVE